MPRYHFNIRQDHKDADREGIELPDHAAAWTQATRICSEMIHDLDGALKHGHEWRLDVTDDSGKALYSFSFTAEAHEVPVMDRE